MLIFLVSNKEISHGRRTFRGTLRRHPPGLLLGGVARSSHPLGLPGTTLASIEAMDVTAQRSNHEPTTQDPLLLHAAGPALLSGCSGQDIGTLSLPVDRHQAAGGQRILKRPRCTKRLRHRRLGTGLQNGRRLGTWIGAPDAAAGVLEGLGSAMRH